jgi:hypothetical protein
MSVKMGLLAGFLVCLCLLLGPGFIWVDVRERGADPTHIWMPVPVSLVRLGIAFVPREKLGQAATQAQQWLPVVETACRELEHIPDTVLVEVHDRTDNVRIEKRHGSFYVNVISDRDEVHVSFPLRAASSIVAQVARASAAHP